MFIKNMFNIIKLNEKDNIGIAPMDIPENININYGIKSINNIPYGHKISLKKLKVVILFLSMDK